MEPNLAPDLHSVSERLCNGDQFKDDIRPFVAMPDLPKVPAPKHLIPFCKYAELTQEHTR